MIFGTLSVLDGIVAEKRVGGRRTEGREESPKLAAPGASDTRLVFPDGGHFGTFPMTAEEASKLTQALTVCRTEMEGNLSNLLFGTGGLEDSLNINGVTTQETSSLAIAWSQQHALKVEETDT
ncbi:unnamed protein product [Caenorhabditis auriculariae]|uniref:Uncharacterized protein n=1 Tax=Caenorhabditis auriculariae TaxID=2777116 RepID=A0A8S1GMQ5_9PELO|nr:unnamed protein product [Caenorhabditis auriculariae]